MTSQQLEKGRKINEELLRWEKLKEHFENTKINDPILEVQDILTGYKNLMSGFVKTDLAKLMIEAIKQKTNERIIELTKEFYEL